MNQALIISCIIFCLFRNHTVDSQPFNQRIDNGHGRFRRSSPDFYRLIQCHQPEVMVLRKYGDYGCFCGFAGHGIPLDGTDGCCEIHDKCYGEAKKLPRTSFEKVLATVCGEICLPYKMSCIDSTTACSPNNTVWGAALCKCDRDAAKCLAEMDSTYSERLHNIDPDLYCTNETNATIQLLKKLLGGNKTNDTQMNSSKRMEPNEATTISEWGLNHENDNSQTSTKSSETIYTTVIYREMYITNNTITDVYTGSGLTASDFTSATEANIIRIGKRPRLSLANTTTESDFMSLRPRFAEIETTTPNSGNRLLSYHVKIVSFINLHLSSFFTILSFYLFQTM